MYIARKFIVGTHKLNVSTFFKNFVFAKFIIFYNTFSSRRVYATT